MDSIERHKSFRLWNKLEMLWGVSGLVAGTRCSATSPEIVAGLAPVCFIDKYKQRVNLELTMVHFLRADDPSEWWC